MVPLGCAPAMHDFGNFSGCASSDERSPNVCSLFLLGFISMATTFAARH